MCINTRDISMLGTQIFVNKIYVFTQIQYCLHVKFKKKCMRQMLIFNMRFGQLKTKSEQIWIFLYRLMQFRAVQN